MSDFTDMVLEGLMCQECGVFMGGDGAGFPVSCSECASGRRPKQEPAKAKAKSKHRKRGRGPNKSDRAARIAWLLRSFDRMEPGSLKWKKRSAELRGLGVKPPTDESALRCPDTEAFRDICDIDPCEGEY